MDVVRFTAVSSGLPNTLDVIARQVPGSATQAFSFQ